MPEAIKVQTLWRYVAKTPRSVTQIRDTNRVFVLPVLLTPSISRQLSPISPIPALERPEFHAAANARFVRVSKPRLDQPIDGFALLLRRVRRAGPGREFRARLSRIM